MVRLTRQLKEVNKNEKLLRPRSVKYFRYGVRTLLVGEMVEKGKHGWLGVIPLCQDFSGGQGNQTEASLDLLQTAYMSISSILQPPSVLLDVPRSVVGTSGSRGSLLTPHCLTSTDRTSLIQTVAEIIEHLSYTSFSLTWTSLCCTLGLHNYLINAR